MANENITAAAKAEAGPVTADQRIASSEAIVANRNDIKQFNKRIATKTKKSPKKTKKEA